MSQDFKFLLITGATTLLMLQGDDEIDCLPSDTATLFRCHVRVVSTPRTGWTFEQRTRREEGTSTLIFIQFEVLDLIQYRIQSAVRHTKHPSEADTRLPRCTVCSWLPSQ